MESLYIIINKEKEEILCGRIGLFLTANNTILQYWIQSRRYEILWVFKVSTIGKLLLYFSSIVTFVDDTDIFSHIWRTVTLSIKYWSVCLNCITVSFNKLVHCYQKGKCFLVFRNINWQMFWGGNMLPLETSILWSKLFPM